MAQPIPFHPPKPDARAALQSRLQSAPADHAEALLTAYEVIQGLHDAGVFDLMRGALESKDRVLNIAVAAAGSEASIRAIRNLLLLINMLGEIDPDVLKTFTQSSPRALKMMLRQPEPPGLWRLVQDFLWNQDFRHGMAALNTMLEVFGKNFANAVRRDQESAPPRLQPAATS